MNCAKRLLESLQVYVGNRPELSMSAPNDFFQLLGVEMEAEAPEIRLAYRSLQRIVHPDIAGIPFHVRPHYRLLLIM